MKHTSKLQCACPMVSTVYRGRKIDFERSSFGEEYAVTVSETGGEGITYWLTGRIEQIRNGYGWGKSYDRYTGCKGEICLHMEKQIADFLLFVDTEIFGSKKLTDDGWTSLMELACKRFIGLVYGYWDD